MHGSSDDPHLHLPQAALTAACVENAPDPRAYIAKRLYGKEAAETVIDDRGRLAEGWGDGNDAVGQQIVLIADHVVRNDDVRPSAKNGAVRYRHTGGTGALPP